MRKSALTIATAAVLLLSGAATASAMYPTYGDDAFYSYRNSVYPPQYSYSYSPPTPTYYPSNSLTLAPEAEYMPARPYSYQYPAYPYPYYQPYYRYDTTGYDGSRYTFDSGYYGTCNGQPCGGAFRPNSPYYGGFRF